MFVIRPTGWPAPRRPEGGSTLPKLRGAVAINLTRLRRPCSPTPVVEVIPAPRGLSFSPFAASGWFALCGLSHYWRTRRRTLPGGMNVSAPAVFGPRHATKCPVVGHSKTPPERPSDSLDQNIRSCHPRPAVTTSHGNMFTMSHHAHN